MRSALLVLVGVFGGIGIMNFFQGTETPMSRLVPESVAMAASEVEEPKPWTGDDLLEMAKLYDQQADELTEEAVRLEQRATSLMMKPHMDPKGFHRMALTQIASSRWKAAKELRELAVMHRIEGQRLLAKNQSGGA